MLISADTAIGHKLDNEAVAYVLVVALSQSCFKICL